MSPRSIASLAIGLASIAAPYPAAVAADRYVTTAGLATNAGTLASPWSLAKAAASATAGDIVFIAGGTYATRISITATGTASAPIVFRAVEGEVPILDQNGITPSGSESAIITIANRNYIIIQGLTVCNNRIDSELTTPIGIHVKGTCQGVQLRDNNIHAIEQNNTVLGNFNANAHGILVQGTSSTALDGLIIDGNTLYNLRLGASEALSVSGNVTNFRITRNSIHHCNNIGIDLIGYEGIGPGGMDRARNGLVAQNVVHAIDARYNPAYGGDLTTGGGTPSAAGIYVDGGTNNIIEANQIDESNFGIELASESGTGFSDYITVRNNLIRHNQGPGLIMGGYNSAQGATEHCTITGNTFYQNDTSNTGSGQIEFQFYVSNNTFKNNIIWAQRTSKQMVIQSVGNNAAGAIGAGNLFGHNLYFYEGAAATPAPVFKLYQSGANQTYSSLAAWQSTSGMADSGATFENPAFSVPLPTPGSPVTAYQPIATSPAVNTGDPTFTPGADEKDFFQKSRVRGGRVDRGFSEN